MKSYKELFELRQQTFTISRNSVKNNYREHVEGVWEKRKIEKSEKRRGATRQRVKLRWQFITSAVNLAWPRNEFIKYFRKRESRSDNRIGDAGRYQSERERREGGTQKNTLFIIRCSATTLYARRGGKRTHNVDLIASSIPFARKLHTNLAALTTPPLRV